MATAKRRDAGAAERTSLENGSRGNATGGEIPLSATIQTLTPRLVCDAFHTWRWLKVDSSNPLLHTVAWF